MQATQCPQRFDLDSVLNEQSVLHKGACGIRVDGVFFARNTASATSGANREDDVRYARQARDRTRTHGKEHEGARTGSASPSVEDSL
jgi:hypothetical protein